MRQARAKKFKAMLKANGLKQVDINMAFKLAGFIEKLDKLVFPENPSWVQITHRSTEDDLTACCNFGPIDSYTIPVPGLNNKIKLFREFAPVFVKTVEEKYQLASIGNKLPVDAVLVSIAAHEVRHLVQKRRRPKKLFKAKLFKNPGSDIIAHIRSWARDEANRVRRYAKKVNSKDDCIMDRVNPKEIDANIIEMLSLNIFIINRSLSDIATIVQAGT